MYPRFLCFQPLAVALLSALVTKHQSTYSWLSGIKGFIKDRSQTGSSFKSCIIVRGSGVRAIRAAICPLCSSVKFDYQSYETDNGAYDALFYKFTQYNDDYTKDWETETNPDYEFKVRHVHSGPFTCVIMVNPTAQRATIEYHCSFLE